MQLYATRGRMEVYDLNGRAFIRRLKADGTLDREWQSPDRTPAEWVQLNNHRPKKYPWSFA